MKQVTLFFFLVVYLNAWGQFEPLEDTTYFWMPGKNWVEVDMLPGLIYLGRGYPVEFQAKAGWKYSLNPKTRLKANLSYFRTDPEFRDDFYYQHKFEVLDSLQYVREHYNMTDMGMNLTFGFEKDVFNRPSTLYGGAAAFLGWRQFSETYRKSYWVPNTSLGCLTCLEPSPFNEPVTRIEDLFYFTGGIELTVGYRQHIWKGFYIQLQISPRLTYAVAQRDRSTFYNSTASLSRSYLSFDLLPVQLTLSFNW